jgi:hypothetical protein
MMSGVLRRLILHSAFMHSSLPSGGCYAAQCLSDHRAADHGVSVCRAGGGGRTGEDSATGSVLLDVRVLFGGIAVAFPDATSAIARPLGIARGADLVFYLAILFMLVGFYMMYVRLRRLDANITQLVRHLAIQNAQSGRLRMTQPKSAGKSSKAQPI